MQKEKRMKPKGFSPLENFNRVKGIFLRWLTPPPIKPRSLERGAGFTLIEMTVVIIIVGVLTSIALPRIIKIVEKSRQAEAINILIRMYKGYRILAIDEAINLATGDFTNGTNPAMFNPDESNILPNVPTGRSDMSWKALGFELNPNYDQTVKAYFSYDFLKSGEQSEQGSGRIGTSRPPGSAGLIIAVAWRKTSNDKPWGELFSVDFTKWIYINMNTGNITKSEHYR